MSEYVRSINISIEVDTNKRTIKKEFKEVESFGYAAELVAGAFEDIEESLV